MPTYATPGVYYETTDLDRAALNPARVDVCGFVGVAERGPLHTPVRLSTWTQYRSVFGGFGSVGCLAYAVKAFFDNGGRTCHVVRVAAPVTDLALAGGQPADRRSSVLAGAVPAGAVVTVAQGPVVHDYLAVTAVGGVVTWDRPLSAEYDLTQPLALRTGAAAASVELPGDDGAGACLDVRASSPGAWGKRLAVSASRTAGAAASTSAAPQPASRLYSLVTNVAEFPVGALVRITQGDPTVVSRRVVTSVDPARGRLGWDAAVDPGYDLTRPIRLEADETTLAVILDGTLAEVHQGLSLRPEHPRFAPDVLAVDSALVRATLADPMLPPSPPRPYAAPEPGPSRSLRGGRDGTAGVRLVDVLGDPGAPERAGLRTYELVPEVALLAMPDVVAEPVEAAAYAPEPVPEPDPCGPAYRPCASGPAAPEVPAVPPAAQDPVLVEGWAGFSPAEVLAAQASLVTHCELAGDRLALLDPPRLSNGTLDLAALLDWRARFDSSYAALHAPWVKVLDPVRPSELRAVPPSGHVAGVVGRVDADRGAAQAPANEELAWAFELDGDIGAAEHGRLNDAGISCLRQLAGRGLRVYGACTLAGPAGPRLLNVRRLLLMIRRTLRAELHWAAFEPADLELRRLLTLAVSGYLTTLWHAGALAGASPEEAFFVRADDALNPPEDAASGRLTVEVGVAPVLPAEFVVLRVGRTEAGLELREASDG